MPLKKKLNCDGISTEIMIKEFPKEGICFSCSEFTYHDGFGTCPRAMEFIHGGMKNENH